MCFWFRADNFYHEPDRLSCFHIKPDRLFASFQFCTAFGTAFCILYNFTAFPDGVYAENTEKKRWADNSIHTRQSHQFYQYNEQKNIEPEKPSSRHLQNISIFKRMQSTTPLSEIHPAGYIIFSEALLFINPNIDIVREQCRRCTCFMSSVFAKNKII